jgi:hypothetical protein
LTHWAACRFAELVGPLLSEAEALEFIIASAMRTGLPYREALATARSGLGRRGHG